MLIYRRDIKLKKKIEEIEKLNESASLHNLSRKSISNDVFLKLYKKETKAF